MRKSFPGDTVKVRAPWRHSLRAEAGPATKLTSQPGQRGLNYSGSAGLLHFQAPAAATHLSPILLNESSVLCFCFCLGGAGLASFPTFYNDVSQSE